MLDSALGDGQLSSEEHRQRVAAATNAATLGDLRALVTDLPMTNAPVQLPNLKPRRLPGAGTGWGIRVAIAGVLVLFGMGVGWGLYGNTSSPLNFTSDPGAKSDGVGPVVLTAPRQLQSLGGLTGLFEQMRQKFGDTQGFRLVVYPDYASLDRPDPTEERRMMNLAKFDMKAIIGVLRGAPETLGIKPGDVTSTYLIIDPSGDPLTPDAVEVSIYVSSDFGSGNIELNPDGSTKRVGYPS